MRVFLANTHFLCYNSAKRGGVFLKTVKLGRLLQTDYNVRLLSYIILEARAGKKYTCINMPKAHNLLRYVYNSSTVYRDSEANVIYAADGEVVYTPRGSRYEVETFDIKQGGKSLQLDFLIYDSEGNEVVLCEEDVHVFECSGDKSVRYLFEKLGRLCESEDALPSEKKSVIFEILSLIGAPERTSDGSPAIKKGVAYLKLHYNENPSVKKLAQMCAISEEYFRRLFKKELGMNPCEYRNRLRLSKACDYLTYGEMGIEEISCLLGYSTASHFSKEFKRAYGVSPLKYRGTR